MSHCVNCSAQLLSDKMAIFDPTHAIFDIPVHTATFYIAILCVVLKVAGLVGNLIRACINRDVCWFCCGLGINMLFIVPSALLLYGNVHRIAYLYWPFLIFAVLFTVVAIPLAFIKCCLVSCVCCSVLCSRNSTSRSRTAEEGVHLSDEDARRIEEFNLARSIAWIVGTTLSIGFLIFYIYAITVVNRDHNLLLKGPMNITSRTSG